MSVNQRVKAISFTKHEESEMYITATLFFNTVSLHFHTLSVAVKLPDSIGEEGFQVVSQPMYAPVHSLLNHCQTGDHVTAL
jgi:hypothetical protein